MNNYAKEFEQECNNNEERIINLNEQLDYYFSKNNDKSDSFYTEDFILLTKLYKYIKKEDLYDVYLTIINGDN